MRKGTKFGYSKRDVGHIYQDALISERYWKILKVLPNLSREEWDGLMDKYGVDFDPEDYNKSGRGAVLVLEFTKKNEEYVEQAYYWGNSPVVFYLKNSGYLDGAIRVR